MKEITLVAFGMVIALFGIIKAQKGECLKRGYSETNVCGCYNQIGLNKDYEILECDKGLEIIKD